MPLSKLGKQQYAYSFSDFYLAYAVLAIIHKTRTRILILGLLLLAGWLVATPWWAAYRQLPELTQIRGQLRTATIHRATGKNTVSCLSFTLSGYSQSFIIRESQSDQPLQILLLALQRGQPATVFYAPEYSLFGSRGANASVYQIEIAGAIIYPWEEVHQHYLNQGAWLLLFSITIGLPLLGYYLRRPATF
jgi:hypothetical protein